MERSMLSSQLSAQITPDLIYALPVQIAVVSSKIHHFKHIQLISAVGEGVGVNSIGTGYYQLAWLNLSLVVGADYIQPASFGAKNRAAVFSYSHSQRPDAIRVTEGGQ